MLNCEIKNMIKTDKRYKYLVQEYSWIPTKTHPLAHTLYALGHQDNKTIYLHRLIMEIEIGRKLNKNERIDHINGNGLDNRLKNLRLCSHRQNIANQLQRKSSSKYKGVSYSKRYKKWESKISPNYSTIYLGRYDNEIEAAQKYNEAAIKYYGEFARLNNL